MKKTFSVTLALLIVALACACTGPATIPTKVAVPSNALFFDDFSSTNSGWSQVQTTTTSEGTAAYFDGHFRISIPSNSAQVIANPSKSFPGDVIIQVDMLNTGSSAPNYAGVICRYQDPYDYYMFLITSDGDSGILMDKAGKISMISPGAKFLKMNGINLGKSANHIQADCIGETLTLFANGKQVSLSYDNSITGTGVGLVVRSSSYQGGAEVTFGNFLVTKP